VANGHVAYEMGTERRHETDCGGRIRYNPYPPSAVAATSEEIMLFRSGEVTSAAAPPDAAPRTLARNRLGVMAVLAFIMASVAPLTVAAGVIPTAYAATGLTGIPAAFIVIAIILGVFSAGYVAMARHITNSGAFYAFISRGLGRVTGVSSSLIALLSYNFLQVALYGALGPAIQAEAAAHLGLHQPWWAWALGAWALVTILGQARVEIAGKVLGTLLAIELVVTIIEAVLGLAHPAGGHLALAGLSPAKLFSGGFGTFGVLAVIAVLGFVGFEQAPVFSEEARSARRTVPTATYIALGAIAVVYAGASWAMSVHAGLGHVVAAATAQGPGLLFGLGGSGGLSQAAQLLFMTSLFAAALAFHNVVWRYMYALGREHVLPAALGRTGGSNIPRAASLVQSAVALVVIVLYAATGLTPMTKLFFWLGTTGGFGILVLLTLTSVSVIAFFARDHHGEAVWRRVAAPALAAGLLGVIVVLALLNYGTLLGSSPGDTVNWALPASFAVIAVIGAAWGLGLRAGHPEVYAAIGLGARAVTVPPTPAVAPAAEETAK
jgi:amino acid transporter